jgi:hypothetical protein
MPEVGTRFWGALPEGPPLPPRLSTAADALWLASKAGDSDGVRSALKAGADPNTAPDYSVERSNALMLAVLCGQVECARLLLDAGAAVDGTNRHGQTALHYATLKNSTALVSLLLEAGADAALCDASGRHAIMYAAERAARLEVLKLLCERVPRDKRSVFTFKDEVATECRAWLEREDLLGPGFDTPPSPERDAEGSGAADDATELVDCTVC